MEYGIVGLIILALDIWALVNVLPKHDPSIPSVVKASL